jgi:ABC-type polysaccharide/polyol phosphate export permease
MFSPTRKASAARNFFSQLELIYHASIRQVRKSHGNAIIGLLMNMMQTVMMIIVFYVMYKVLGLTSMRVRGDFILYIMSGIFLFFTHTRTLGAVSAAEGSTSAMMKHAPMNPIVSVAAAAIGTLYVQLLSMALVLGIYSVAFHPVEIHDPTGALGMIMLAWSSGVGIGLIFRAFRPWQPELVTIATTIFMRANMVASGKMFVANSLPPRIRDYFSWNPLFHTIDQCRGFVFENYNPHFTSYMYPVYVTLACLMFGLIAEFYTSQHASLSWEMGR